MVTTNMGSFLFVLTVEEFLYGDFVTVDLYGVFLLIEGERIWWDSGFCGIRWQSFNHHCRN